MCTAGLTRSTDDTEQVAPSAQQQQFMVLNEVAIGTEMASPGSGPYAFMPVYINGNSTKPRGPQGYGCSVYSNASINKDSNAAAISAASVGHQWDETTFPTPDAAASTSVQHIFNVKDARYGATGDGKTDDTKAIQMAFDDAAKFASNSAEASATVFLPKGFYRLFGTLKLSSDVAGTIAVMGVPSSGF